VPPTVEVKMESPASGQWDKLMADVDALCDEAQDIRNEAATGALTADDMAAVKAISDANSTTGGQPAPAPAADEAQPAQEPQSGRKRKRNR
jgi:hypothetical protein